MNTSRLFFQMFTTCVCLLVSADAAAQSRIVEFRNNSCLRVSVSINSSNDEPHRLGNFINAENSEEFHRELTAGLLFVSFKAHSFKAVYPVIRKTLPVQENQERYTITIHEFEIGTGVPANSFVFNIFEKWQREDGLVIEFDYKEDSNYGTLEGRVVELSPAVRKYGLKVGWPFMFLHRIGIDTYEGFQVTSMDTMGHVTLTVNANRDAMSGGWKRIGPVPKAEISGIWQHRDSYKVRFIKNGNEVTGTLIYLPEKLKSLGFSLDERIFDLIEINLSVYSGKIKRRSSGGEVWWEDIILCPQEKIMLANNINLPNWFMQRSNTP